MSPLGPRAAKWTLETLSGVLSFSKIVGGSVQATSKLIPGISLKEHHLAKWKFDPDFAQVNILHQPVAVKSATALEMHDGLN